ncbi:MAG: hypothetical protein RB191_05690 [Terriglobia bacterium]|nr:hypothetical protein [Terriglobia bacterium]
MPQLYAMKSVCRCMFPLLGEELESKFKRMESIHPFEVMTVRKLLAIAALPLFLLPFTGCAHPQPPPYYAPPPPGAVARQGFDTGVAAARRDLSLGRRPNANRHPRYRNPPVPPGQPTAIYRDNFLRGYRLTYRGGR